MKTLLLILGILTVAAIAVAALNHWLDGLYPPDDRDDYSDDEAQ